MRDFNTFMGQLKSTNATLDFFVDFPKIRQKVKSMEISLCTLNYLIGKRDLKEAVTALWDHDRSIFQVMSILIALHPSKNMKVLDEGGGDVRLCTLFDSVDGVMTFLTETGLADILTNQEITNLVDYVFGVETGLDSNARKNRSGKLMEHLIGEAFKEAGIKYLEQVPSRNYPEVASVLGPDKKVFDFAVTTPLKTYLIEVNFYSGGGSKLNEVARSYAEIGPKINQLLGYEFVWITDGKGWFLARNKLQKAFDVIPSVYNILTLKDFLHKLQNELC